MRRWSSSSRVADRSSISRWIASRCWLASLIVRSAWLVAARVVASLSVRARSRISVASSLASWRMAARRSEMPTVPGADASSRRHCTSADSVALARSSTWIVYSRNDATYSSTWSRSYPRNLREKSGGSCSLTVMLMGSLHDDWAPTRCLPVRTPPSTVPRDRVLNDRADRRRAQRRASTDSEVGHHARLLLHLQHRERATEAQPDREAQREVEDLVVGELLAESCEELVVEALVVDGEALGVLDGEALSLGVTGPRAPVVEVAVVVVGDAGVEHRLRAGGGARRAVVELRDAEACHLALSGREDAAVVHRVDHVGDGARHLRSQLEHTSPGSAGTVGNLDACHACGVYGGCRARSADGLLAGAVHREHHVGGRGRRVGCQLLAPHDRAHEQRPDEQVVHECEVGPLRELSARHPPLEHL